MLVRYVIRNRKVVIHFIGPERLPQKPMDTYRPLFKGRGSEYERHNLIDMIFRAQYKGYGFEVVEWT